MAEHIGLISQGALIPTTSINIIEPYHAKDAQASTFIAEPVITVEGVADLSDLALIPQASTKVVCCALPAGSAGPADSGELYSGYSIYRWPPHWTYKRVNENVSTITSVQATSPSVDAQGVWTLPNDWSPISGNALYDVYAAYVSKSGPHDIIDFGGMQTLTGVRTRAPYPHFGEEPDANTRIDSLGLEVLDNPVQMFTFTFEQLLQNFDKTNQLGPAWIASAAGDDYVSDIAASGFVRMSCSGFLTEMMYQPTYTAGTLPAAGDPYYQYLMPSTGPTGVVMEWRVPKFIDPNHPDRYESYGFEVRYIDSSGILGPAVQLRYGGPQLKKEHEQTDISSSDISIPDSSEWVGPTPVPIKNGTKRYRMAVGVNDIDLQDIQYADEGSHVSVLFASEEPIYALSVDATEQLIQKGDQPPWDFVKYYVQFGGLDTDEWHRITLRSRSEEVDDEGNPVPRTIILDSLMEDGQKDSFESNDIQFVKMDRPVYNFKIKTEISTAKSPTKGSWSPFIYDRKVMVLGRSILQSAAVERYLFT